MIDVIKVVLPPCSGDEISEGLRRLTQVLCDNKIGDDCDPSGGLGGNYGYGVDFENDIFMLHRYCWCEKDDCPWCGGDAGPLAQSRFWGGDPTQRAPNFCHKPSGSAIYWYKYIGRGMEMDLKVPWEQILADCMNSLSARLP